MLRKSLLLLALVSSTSIAFTPTQCFIEESKFKIDIDLEPHRKTIVTGVNRLNAGYLPCRVIDPESVQISEKKSTPNNAAFIVKCGTGSSALWVNFTENQVKERKSYPNSPGEVSCYPEDKSTFPGQDALKTYESSHGLITNTDESTYAAPASTQLFQRFGYGIYVAIAVFIIIWAILWFFVPFMIYAMNKKLGRLENILNRAITAYEQNQSGASLPNERRRED